MKNKEKEFARVRMWGGGQWRVDMYGKWDTFGISRRWSKSVSAPVPVAVEMFAEQSEKCIKSGLVC